MHNKSMETKNNTQTGDTMNIKAILKSVYLGRGTIYRSMVIAFSLAVLIVVLSPKEYDTRVVLLAESNAKSGSSGLLGDLGGMSGLNIGNLIGLNLNSSASDALTSDLYPDIVKSTPFLLDILQQKIYYPKIHKTLTISSYLRKYSRPSMAGLAGYLINKIKGEKNSKEIKKYSKGVLILSKGQNDLLKTLSDMVSVEIQDQGNKILKRKSKIFGVTVEAQDPMISALLADSVMSSLKRYVVNYNTRKATKDLAFIHARYLDARENYYNAQKALADYSDSNNNVILASVNIKKERLKREFELATNVYMGMAKLLEKAKIRVQDRTPVFTVIEPPKVPLKKSAPKTTLIIVEMLLVGAFIGFCIELVKIMLHPPGNTIR